LQAYQTFGGQKDMGLIGQLVWRGHCKWPQDG
jgi:hypothetical protein